MGRLTSHIAEGHNPMLKQGACTGCQRRDAAASPCSTPVIRQGDLAHLNYSSNIPVLILLVVIDLRSDPCQEPHPLHMGRARQGVTAQHTDQPWNARSGFQAMEHSRSGMF